jgi:hypothetical protein
MRRQALFVGIVLLLGTCAFGQSYDMRVHLSSGETVIIPLDDIQRVEFANIPAGVQDPEGEGSALGVFRLLQNYPNPFNPRTTIEYEIPDVADVTVRIYDLRGALVRELLHDTQLAGPHRVTWNGTDGRLAPVASGVHFCVVGRGLLQRRRADLHGRRQPGHQRTRR